MPIFYLIYLDCVDGSVDQRGQRALADVDVRLHGQVLIPHLDLRKLHAHPASKPVSDDQATAQTGRKQVDFLLLLLVHAWLNANIRMIDLRVYALLGLQIEAVPEPAEEPLAVVVDGLEHPLHELAATACVEVGDVHLLGRRVAFAPGVVRRQLLLLAIFAEDAAAACHQRRGLPSHRRKRGLAGFFFFFEVKRGLAGWRL